VVPKVPLVVLAVVCGSVVNVVGVGLLSKKYTNIIMVLSL